jgi:hypothetical protein
LNLEFADENRDYNIQRVRHYYGVVGARFELYMDSWLDISSEVQYLPGAPILFSGNLVYDFDETFWITTSYSTANQVRFGGGVFCGGSGGNMLSIGYVFSNFFQSYGPAYGSSHELRISYSWN